MLGTVAGDTAQRERVEYPLVGWVALVGGSSRVAQGCGMRGVDYSKLDGERMTPRCCTRGSCWSSCPASEGGILQRPEHCRKCAERG